MVIPTLYTLGQYLTPVVYFAEPVITGLYSVWTDKHSQQN